MDMPGYGFAYAAEDTVREWTELMHRYVAEPRRVLKRVYLLLDGRHGAKHVDQLFMERLDAAGTRFTCVLTKVGRSVGGRVKVAFPPAPSDTAQVRSYSGSTLRRSVVVLLRCDTLQPRRASLTTSLPL